MTLGRCLEALRWNQQHRGGGNLRVVPYRESKVTHLFRDALHGWGQVVLSVNVSPASRDYDETAHVLKVGPGGGHAPGAGCGSRAASRQLAHCAAHPIQPDPPHHTLRSPHPAPTPQTPLWQYAALATQIGTLQQAEAPRRTIKAVSPAIKKQKRKAALPPEARRGQGQAK